MESQRALGAVALAAIVVAAVSFAVVDVSTANAPCATAPGGCADASPAPVAIAFAALGTLALLVAVLPAVTWIVAEARRTQQLPHDVEARTARGAMPRRVAAPEEDEREADEREG